jgi:hypothetical protein
MTKIVYNACFGGFGLSEAALRRYAELKGFSYGSDGDEHWHLPYLSDLDGKIVHADDIARTDTALVQVVEELGEQANTRFSDLRIEDLPAGTKYRIDEYDGSESVMTIDCYNWSVA